MPPGTSEVRHYHQNANQFFTFCGKFDIEVDGSEHALNAAQGLHISAGRPPSGFNRSTNDVEFLVF